MIQICLKPILFGCVLIITVLVHTQVYAYYKKTCGVWMTGPYTVKDKQGKKWTCDQKRECVEREYGLCESLFGCDTTYITEYADCRETITNRYKGLMFDQGISPWIPHRWWWPNEVK